MTLISVTRKLRVEALLEIEDKDFAHWYELGVWWAMYGDFQGNGPYEDRYLIGNIGRHLREGHYNDLSSHYFLDIAFYIGMAHGGMIDPKTHQLRASDTMVVLTDPDFTKGYHVGRDYYFYEAPETEKHPSDTWLKGVIHEWALGYKEWREADAVLSYILGCRIGALSAALIPAAVPAFF